MPQLTTTSYDSILAMMPFSRSWSWRCRSVELTSFTNWSTHFICNKIIIISQKQAWMSSAFFEKILFYSSFFSICLSVCLTPDSITDIIITDTSWLISWNKMWKWCHLTSMYLDTFYLYVIKRTNMNILRTCEVGATSVPLKVKTEVSYSKYYQVFIIYYQPHFLSLPYHHDITCGTPPYPDARPHTVNIQLGIYKLHHQFCPTKLINSLTGSTKSIVN
jgi:hypothetical protein